MHTGKEKSHELILSRAQPDGKLCYDINTGTEMNRIKNSNLGRATHTARKIVIEVEFTQSGKDEQEKRFQENTSRQFDSPIND